jgi:hypothetical protein
MPLECQLQYLAQFGFQVPDVADAVQTEQEQNAKITDKDTQEIINYGTI